jgi:hypothetical protein
MCCVQRSGSSVSTRTKTTDCRTVWRSNPFMWKYFSRLQMSGRAHRCALPPIPWFPGLFSWDKAIRAWCKSLAFTAWTFRMSPAIPTLPPTPGWFLYGVDRVNFYVLCILLLEDMQVRKMSIQFTASALFIWKCPCFQQFLFSQSNLTTLSELFCGLFMSIRVSVRVSTSRFTKATLTTLWQLHNKHQSPHNDANNWSKVSSCFSRTCNKMVGKIMYD